MLSKLVSLYLSPTVISLAAGIIAYIRSDPPCRLSSTTGPTSNKNFGSGYPEGISRTGLSVSTYWVVLWQTGTLATSVIARSFSGLRLLRSNMHHHHASSIGTYSLAVSSFLC